MPIKPTEKEEEYFVRMEFERKKKIEMVHQEKLAAKEKERLKELHHMKCPKCGMNLVEIEYRSIKVDRCSACEGVWLDKGELKAVADLDKLLLDKLYSVFRTEA
jgi:uncharacterized protein